MRILPLADISGEDFLAEGPMASLMPLYKPLREHSQLTANKSMVCTTISRVHATAVIDVP